jgi:hypothetical protein
MRNGELVASYPQFEDEVTVERITFLPDSRHAALTMWDGSLVFLELPSGTILWRKKLGVIDPIS